MRVSWNFKTPSTAIFIIIEISRVWEKKERNKHENWMTTIGKLTENCATAASDYHDFTTGNVIALEREKTRLRFSKTKKNSSNLIITSRIINY